MSGSTVECPRAGGPPGKERVWLGLPSHPGRCHCYFIVWYPNLLDLVTVMSPGEDMVSRGVRCQLWAPKSTLFLDDRAKVSFLPASRMKRELVFLEPKNLGRIILDKSVWQGHQCRQKPLGPGVGPTMVFVSLVHCSVLSPTPPTTRSPHEMLPVMGVARLYLLCPLCLFLAKRLKGLWSVGQKCGVAEYSQCPPVQWLDRLSQGASSCVLGPGT